MNEDDDDEDEEIQRPSTRPSNTKTNDAIVNPKWIGNVRCFLHDSNGKPRATIGPNWGFTIVLFCLVGGILHICIKGMINLVYCEAAWYWLAIGATSITGGLIAFTLTLLGDPGIPAEVYENHAKPNREIKVLPEINDEGLYLCNVCQVYVHKNREHCDLCDVCIDDLDHHCVFFSKCIGGTNVAYFRLSILAFIINMSYFLIIQGFVTLSKKKHH